jgi:hypothetical protein
LVLVIALVLFPVWLGLAVVSFALTVGPYLASPIALFAKLRFQVSFVVLLRVGAWTGSDWVQFASLINQIASMINLDKIRKAMVFDYVTNGADSTYDMKEVETRAEMQYMSFMKLMVKFGRVKAFFLWLSLTSEDMERLTKKDADPPLRLKHVPIEVSGVGYDADGSIEGSNGLVISDGPTAPSVSIKNSLLTNDGSAARSGLLSPPV